MRTTDVVVIGAGHAGLAMSHCLGERGIDHVVLERGRVAQRWRSARWDSFRLLTPNWLSRLPGWHYTGTEPDGFMSGVDFADHLLGYARAGQAPVLEHTAVTAVTADGDRYQVATDTGTWRSSCVVIATGYHSRAVVPRLAAGLPSTIAQLSPAAYRSPGQLPDGAVLVVGGASSGVQIAHELARAGQAVTLAVGEHTRLPRRYRDRDILWWLDRIGSLDRTIDELPDPHRALREPSLQLSAGQSLDLNVLAHSGVRLTGRLTGIEDGAAYIADDLTASSTRADARMRRVLDAIDAHAADIDPGPADRPPSFVAGPGPRRIRLAGFGSIIWATGFGPAYPWLRVPVLDERGHLRHRRGITDAGGLFAIGLRFQHRRSATFIDGARHDAEYLADQIAARLSRRRTSIHSGDSGRGGSRP